MLILIPDAVKRHSVVDCTPRHENRKNRLYVFHDCWPAKPSSLLIPRLQKNQQFTNEWLHIMQHSTSEYELRAPTPTNEDCLYGRRTPMAGLTLFANHRCMCYGKRATVFESNNKIMVDGGRRTRPGGSAIFWTDWFVRDEFGLLPFGEVAVIVITSSTCWMKYM